MDWDVKQNTTRTKDIIFWLRFLRVHKILVPCDMSDTNVYICIRHDRDGGTLTLSGYPQSDRILLLRLSL
jgi:hypothetical protein